MTRYDIRIDELVLDGVPPQLAEGIAGLVQARLGELAGGAAAAGPAGTVSTSAQLADAIAAAVWQQVGSNGAGER
jgi:hypothetical protein